MHYTILKGAKFILVLCIMFSLVECRKQNADKQAIEIGRDTLDMKQGGNFAHGQTVCPPDKGIAVTGESIYTSKCSYCHKRTNEKLVGPGWKGITGRRTAEWILNTITTTNTQMDSSQVSQGLVLTCEVKMPERNLTTYEACAILEFMRQNDNM